MSNKSPSQPIPIDTTVSGRRRSNSLFSNPGLSPSASPLSSTMSALQTPTSFSTGSGFPRPGIQNSPPSTTSPLTFFLPSSPVKKHSGFPWTSTKPTPGNVSPSNGLSRVLTNPNPSTFNRNESAVAEDDDDPTPLIRSNAGQGGHFRTGSLNWHHNPAGRERAAGVMRRLSLSGALGGGAAKPNISPPGTTRGPSPPLPTPMNTAAPTPYVQSEPASQPFSSAAQQQTHSRSGTPNGVRRGRARGPSDPTGGLKLKKRGVSPMGERMLKGHFDGFGL